MAWVRNSRYGPSILLVTNPLVDRWQKVKRLGLRCPTGPTTALWMVSLFIRASPRVNEPHVSIVRCLAEVLAKQQT